MPKAEFNNVTETWEVRPYELPYIAGDYIILTPTNILTKEDIWINKASSPENTHRSCKRFPMSSFAPS